MPECLFTQADWEVWERIEKRKKERSQNFKSGKYCNSYYYGKCIFCGKKIVGYLIVKHIERFHKDKFYGWEELVKLREKCIKLMRKDG